MKWNPLLLLFFLIPFLVGCDDNSVYISRTVFNNSVDNITNNISINESKYILNFTVTDTGTVTHKICLLNDTCFSAEFTDSDSDTWNTTEQMQSAVSSNLSLLINSNTSQASELSNLRTSNISLHSLQSSDNSSLWINKLNVTDQRFNYSTKAGTGSYNCSGTDKLINITVNSSGVYGTCGTDSTGSSSTVIKYLSYEHNQTITTLTLLPNFTTTLEANKLYEIRCRLLMSTNVTANSPRFAVNITGTTTGAYQTCETATSSTARYQIGVVGNNLGCLSTASIGNNLPTPFYYEGLIQDDATPSNFTLSFIGETAATQYRVYTGSVCYITKLN